MQHKSTKPVRARRPLPRENIPTAVKRAVSERDCHSCRRCGSDRCLVFHHIVPYSERGPDSEENLILLCSACHDEWEHTGRPPYITFFDWLDLPTPTWLMAVLAPHNKDRWARDDRRYTSAQMRSSLLWAFEIWRDARAMAADDDWHRRHPRRRKPPMAADDGEEVLSDDV